MFDGTLSISESSEFMKDFFPRPTWKLFYQMPAQVTFPLRGCLFCISASTRLKRQALISLCPDDNLFTSLLQYLIIVFEGWLVGCCALTSLPGFLAYLGQGPHVTHLCIPTTLPCELRHSAVLKCSQLAG